MKPVRIIYCELLNNFFADSSKANFKNWILFLSIFVLNVSALNVFLKDSLFFYLSSGFKNTLLL